MKTAYITWVIDDKADEDVDNLSLEKLRIVEARRPKEAAVEAALKTHRSKYPWRVKIGVLRAADSRNTWSRKIRKYEIDFGRPISCVRDVE